MAGWNYIIGETLYNQPFVLFDKGTGLAFNGTGIVSATMRILEADLSATTPPITGIALTIDTDNPLRVFLPVVAATPNVPQAVGSYVVTLTITLAASEVRKTFELDLRVYNG